MTFYSPIILKVLDDFPRVRDTYTHLAIWTNAQMKPRLEEVF